VGVASPDTMSEPCMEDPNHNVGDSWSCTDPTCTCTCLSNGHVDASCPPKPGMEVTPVTIEEVMVKVAFGAILALMLCFGVTCCFMFRKNKENRSRAEVLQEVDDIEMEDRQ